MASLNRPIPPNKNGPRVAAKAVQEKNSALRLASAQSTDNRLFHHFFKRLTGRMLQDDIVTELHRLPPCFRLAIDHADRELAWRPGIVHKLRCFEVFGER